MSYNGWSNYETWLCNIWYDACFEELAREAEPGTSCGDMAQRFAGVVDSDCEEELRGTGSGLFKDLIQAGIQEIDFEELADAFMEFVPAKEEEEEDEEE